LQIPHVGKLRHWQFGIRARSATVKILVLRVGGFPIPKLPAVLTPGFKRSFPFRRTGGSSREDGINSAWPLPAVAKVVFPLLGDAGELWAVQPAVQEFHVFLRLTAPRRVPGPKFSEINLWAR